MTFLNYLKAGYAALWIQTHEENRAIAVLSQEAEGYKIFSWDIVSGLRDHESNQVTRMDDPLKPLQSVTPESSILFIKDAHKFIESLDYYRTVKNIIPILKSSGKHLVFVSPVLKIPIELEKDISIYQFNLPTAKELMEVAEKIVKDNELQFEIDEKAVSAAVGLTLGEAENSLALSVIEKKKYDKEVIEKEKLQAVKKSGLMEIYPPVKESELGGLEALKKYIHNRKRGFYEDLPKPKGILLVGLPGCLSGDTIIPISRKRNGIGGKPMTLAALYYRFNGRHGEGVKTGNLKTYLRQWDLSLATKAYSFKKNDGYIGGNKILAVVFSGIKDVYRLTTQEGFSIKATKDHKFCTPDGTYARLEDLKIGDGLVVYGKGQLFENNQTGRNKNIALLQITNVGNHPNARRKVINGLTYTEHPLHRLVVEAALNDMPIEEFLYMLQGDISSLKFLNPDDEVHHIDGNRRNNTKQNLEVFSKAEHSKRHMLSSNKNKFRSMARVQRIKTIDYVGREPTYDIEMKAPYHNFVANGFVVHNSGKSLTAKVTASVLDFPLVRLDISSLKGSLVGESERKMRQATELIDAISPCCVWIDEIEKAIGGVQSSNKTDGGTTAGMFGHLLTWMQESEKPKYIVASCNDIDDLLAISQGALLRRFDDVWFLDLPSEGERKAILAIMNRRYKTKIQDSMTAKMDGWTGAEIEKFAVASVYDGIEEAMKNIKPIFHQNRDKIEKAREWAKLNARCANSSEQTTTKRRVKVELNN